jgi:hypothetical protein
MKALKSNNQLADLGDALLVEIEATVDEEGSKTEVLCHAEKGTNSTLSIVPIK